MHRNDIIIIAVGRELLSGRTLDTNSNYLAKAVTIAGLRVSGIHTIDDVEADIIKTVKRSLTEKPAVIIMTGGLGPTADDRTLRSVAKALGKRFVKNKEALFLIRKRYDELSGKGLLPAGGLNKGRMKMAYMPSGAMPLSNPAGTAPAAFINHKSTALFCLPGVPAEMKSITVAHVLPWIKQHLPAGYRVERSVMTGYYDESVLRNVLDKISAAYPDVYIKSSPAGFLKEKSLEVFFTSSGRDKSFVEKRVGEAVGMLEKMIHK